MRLPTPAALVLGAVAGFAMYAGADAWHPPPTAAEVDGMQGAMLARSIEATRGPASSVGCSREPSGWHCLDRADGSRLVVTLYEDGSWRPNR